MGACIFAKPKHENATIPHYISATCKQSTESTFVSFPKLAASESPFTAEWCGFV